MEACTLVIPAYNEEERIHLLLSDITGSGITYFFICDGNDKTAEIIRGFATENPGMRDTLPGIFTKAGKREGHQGRTSKGSHTVCRLHGCRWLYITRGNDVSSERTRGCRWRNRFPVRARVNGDHTPGPLPEVGEPDIQLYYQVTLWPAL